MYKKTRVRQNTTTLRVKCQIIGYTTLSACRISKMYGEPETAKWQIVRFAQFEALSFTSFNIIIHNLNLNRSKH